MFSYSMKNVELVIFDMIDQSDMSMIGINQFELRIIGFKYNKLTCLSRILNGWVRV